MLRSEGGQELKEDEAKIDQLVQGYAVNTWDKVFANEASRYAVIAKMCHMKEQSRLRKQKLLVFMRRVQLSECIRKGDLAGTSVGVCEC